MTPGAPLSLLSAPPRHRVNPRERGRRVAQTNDRSKERTDERTTSERTASHRIGSLAPAPGPSREASIAHGRRRPARRAHARPPGRRAPPPRTTPPWRAKSMPTGEASSPRVDVSRRECSRTGSDGVLWRRSRCIRTRPPSRASRTHNSKCARTVASGVFLASVGARRFLTTSASDVVCVSATVPFGWTYVPEASSTIS